MPVFYQDPKLKDYGNIRDIAEITLTADGWADNKQTISCSSVGENSTLLPNPTSASKQAYVSAGIELTEATAEALTFTCFTVPTEDIAVVVYITDPVVVAERELPFFDLIEMGLPAIEIDGADKAVSVACDTTEIMNACAKGTIRVKLNMFGLEGEAVINPFYLESDNIYQGVFMIYYMNTYTGYVMVGEGYITANAYVVNTTVV